MNRIDRMFAILLRLQRRQRVRAQDLARTFEVSERTIYRDMDALSASGVPIVALPGAGYELAEGYYLPPLLLTPGEASALFLGAHMLMAHSDGRTADEAERAIAKVATVLPAQLRQQTEQIAQAIRFHAPPERFDLDDDRLSVLRCAIAEQRVVRLRYHSHGRNEVTDRSLEPHTLTYASGAWYVAGFCRLRQGMRGFRLDRIDAIELLDEQFAARPSAPPDPAAPKPIEAHVRFAPHVARWVRERQHYGFAGESAGPDGWPHMCYRVDALDELVPWLQSWGAAAEALAPAELRERLREEARKLLSLLT